MHETLGSMYLYAVSSCWKDLYKNKVSDLKLLITLQSGLSQKNEMGYLIITHFHFTVLLEIVIGFPEPQEFFNIEV